MVAETVLRELGRPTLLELLDLTALIAQRDPRRRSRVAARWLARYLEAHERATIEKAAMVASLLPALGSDAHDEAHAALTAMAEPSTGAGRVRCVAS